MIIIDSIFVVLFAYVAGFLYYGLYRNITARFQRRIGPPVYQSFVDSIKFFLKKDTISHGWLFYIGPIVMATGAVMTLLFVPFFSTNSSFETFSRYGNLFLVLYLILLGPLGNALAVGVGGNPFGVMGVVRGLSRLMALEMPFYVSVIALMYINGSADIATIAKSQDIINAMKYPLLFIGAMFAFVGMLNQSPFDVVGAPVEVYSGPASEFSGKFLALLMSQSAIFTFAKLLLMVHLFLGGVGGFFDLIAKSFILFFITVAIGSMYGRLKTPKAIEFLLNIPLIISLIGLYMAVQNG